MGAPAKVVELSVSSILIVGIVGTLVRDTQLLFSFPIPVGTDGFYYLNQVESIRSTGELCYPTVTPLLLYMFGLLSRASSDTVATIKLGALFFLGVLLIAAGQFVSILTREGFSGLAAAAFILASNIHLYFIAEFLNNLAGLSLVILGACSLLKGRVLTGSMLMALAAATHRSVPWIVVSAIVFFLLAIGCLHLKTRSPARVFVVASSMAALAITLNPFLDRTEGLESIGGRVSLLVHLQLCMTVPAIIFSFDFRRWVSVFICLAAFVIISLINYGRPLPAGITAPVLARKTRLMNTLRNWRLPADSVVIAAHGDQFLVSHVLPVNSSSRLSSEQDKLKVWWLLRGPKNVIQNLASLTDTSRKSADCIMVQDSKLRRAFGTLSARDQFMVAAANPHLRKELNPALDTELNRLRYQ